MAILDRIRSTCASALAEGSAEVRVDREGCLKLAVELMVNPTAAQSSQWRLPLRFDSVGDEVNILVLLQLLNVGSGFRVELHAATGSGAWETMLRGMLSLHLMGKKPSASFLAAFELSEISDTFGFEPDVEVAVMPGVYERKPGPLRPLAEHIVRAMNEAGQALLNRGHADFYAFIKAGVAAERQAAGVQASDATWRPSAAAFVSRLADAFLPFRDVGTVESGQEVWIIKKAQLAASHLQRRFGITQPQFFGFHDIDRLTVMADNVLPAVMRHYGAIVLAADLCESIDAGKPLPRGPIETRLRASAVVAGEIITSEIRGLASAAVSGSLSAYETCAGRKLTEEEVSSIMSRSSGSVSSGSETDGAASLPRLASLTESELDEMLWSKGKEPALRKLQRHATKDTYYY